MIKKSLKKHIKLVLLISKPDLYENINGPNTPLAQHRNQILALGLKYIIPVIDSYNAFKNLAFNNVDLKKYMAQSNQLILKDIK